MGPEFSSSDGSAEIARRRRIDKFCDRFEQEWHTDKPPRIEDFLDQAEDGDAEPLLAELLKLEVELRRGSGQQVERQDYLQRFPNQLEIVAALFSANDEHELEPTEDFRANHSAGSNSDDEDKLPAAIGRFKVLSKLGKGGFGVVYLAYDSLAKREVAIKVPKQKQLTARQLELFLDDVRTASQLTHPGIVSIYEVSDSPVAYVVQEHLEGGDLKEYVEKHVLSPRAVVELMIPIAEAVGFAHQRGYTHLDLKPANILLRDNGRPCVADFGLAVHESRQWSEAGRFAGTMPYMSPEQAAGEVHRLDGRSDIWSLGVILYELLSRKRPFTDQPTERLLDEIRFREPRPIRQHDADLPNELWRIVQCCLAKSVLERYQSAADLIDDLKQWLAGGESPRSTSALEDVPANDEPANIIPQGLRSFEAEHSDFYLQLLPGPHDRDGLPNRVRFWKKQIEQQDPDETFSVGLMYGPSGCGKSSLVKAGLLPNLSGRVKPMYVEATARDTEVRLLKGLRKIEPEAPAEMDLPALIAWARSRPQPHYGKILIVIDQFEQWLHTHALDRSDQLVKALRQCDGARVQCVVLVRDDFWMSATNFMRALDIPLTEGFNSAAVDLFDADHARRVLRLFGQAYGKLPPATEELSGEQSEFVQASVDDLASDGKVVCVRLAVFSEMMKGRDWNSEGLERVGGAEGVGVSFLDETFNASGSPPSCRRHRAAIRAVLETLLPDAGSDIKGRMRSYEDLRIESGYGDRAQDFDEVLAILDGDVRLITPTEPDGGSADGDGDPKYYQLTHDFLVPSLRDWLTREKRETLRGKAELRLAERAALWRFKREDRQLPSVGEYLGIRSLVSMSRRSELEREMMRRADRVRGVQLVVAVLLLAGAVLGIGAYRSGTQRAIVGGHVKSLLENPPQVLSGFIDLVRQRKAYAIPLLKDAFQNAESGQSRLHAACALSDLGVHDFDFPFALVDECDPAECSHIIRALQNGSAAWRASLVEEIAERDSRAAATLGQLAGLQNAAEETPKDGTEGEAEKRLELQKELRGKIQANRLAKVRLAIVALHLGDPAPAEAILQSGPDPSERTLLIVTFATWHGDLEQLNAVADAASSWPVSGNDDLISGVALAAGSTDIVQAGESNWQDRLESWFADCPSGGVHSASGWALRKMGALDADLTKTAKRTIEDSPDSQQGWHVTEQLSLVRIPGKGENKAGFWMSDREITVSLFSQFVAEEGLMNWSGPRSFRGVTAAQQRAHPVQMVSWADSARFCNWLTKKEDRNLSACYEIIANDEGKVEVKSIPSANGYRMPTLDEWKHACMAGAATKFFFGNSVEYMPRHGYLRVNSNAQTHVGGELLCNAWGVFDLYGNVDEWVAPTSAIGGGWLTAPELADRAGTIPGKASPVRGIRVIRSIGETR